MTCRYCQKKLEEGAIFCSHCGKKQEDMKVTEIENYDALIRRANKMVKEYDRYPLIPEGNLSIEFIQNVFNFNPLFVLNDLRKAVLDMLLKVTEYKYDEEQLYPILKETYGKHESQHKERILRTLIENYKYDLKHYSFKQHSYMSLRPVETQIFYYAFSIFYISRDLKNGSGMFFARHALKGIGLIHCERSTTPFDGIGSTGRLLELSEFTKDAVVYNKMMQMIESEIEKSGDQESIEQLHNAKREEAAEEKKGCYIATCVYGSYDCPQVWTLRRFRDNSLLPTYWGKVFVKIYYTISPVLVRFFGQTHGFKKFWKALIDRMVKHLQDEGVESTPYEDEKV